MANKAVVVVCLLGAIASGCGDDSSGGHFTPRCRGGDYEMVVFGGNSADAGLTPNILSLATAEGRVCNPHRVNFGVNNEGQPRPTSTNRESSAFIEVRAVPVISLSPR